MQSSNKKEEATTRNRYSSQSLRSRLAARRRDREMREDLKEAYLELMGTMEAFDDLDRALLEDDLDTAKAIMSTVRRHLIGINDFLEPYV